MNSIVSKPVIERAVVLKASAPRGEGDLEIEHGRSKAR
jgi:hypothetical protein